MAPQLPAPPQTPRGQIHSKEKSAEDSGWDVGGCNQKTWLTGLTGKADPAVGFTADCCIVLAVFNPLEHDGGIGLHETTKR